MFILGVPSHNRNTLVNNACCQTAGTNSRPDSHPPSPSLHADYLVLHYRLPDLRTAEELARHTIDWGALDPIDWTKQRTNTRYGKVWQVGYSSAYGSNFLYDQLDDGSINACLVLKGQTLSRIPDFVGLFGRFSQYFDHCSRIDYALDGLDLRSLRQSLHAALSAGNTGNVRNYRWIESCKNRTDWVTLEIGGRDSMLFGRIYDKEIEGLGKFQRFEIECKRELAVEGFNALLSGDLERFYYSALKRWEFYSQKKDKNLSRNEILSEWKQFLKEGIQKLRIERATCNTLLTRRINWIRRQVVKTLSLFREFYGVAGFHSLMQDFIEDGRKRLTEFDLRLLQREQVYAQLAF